MNQIQKTILIVDDDVDLADTYADLAKIKGYMTKTAYSGTDAVEIFKETRPKLVIMDIKMPDIDGWEAFYKIKEIDPNAKIILITGNQYDEDKHKEAKRKTLLLLVTKPVSVDFLTELFARYS